MVNVRRMCLPNRFHFLRICLSRKQQGKLCKKIGYAVHETWIPVVSHPHLFHYLFTEFIALWYVFM